MKNRFTNPMFTNNKFIFKHSFVITLYKIMKEKGNCKLVRWMCLVTLNKELESWLKI